MLLAGVVALAAACSKDSVATDDKGAVNFDIQMSSLTRSNADSFSPETLKVRIYNGEGLLRRYTSMEEIPSPLYLVAGNYSVKVEAGDTKNTAFKAPTGDNATERLKQMLCYYGTQEFTVAAHSIADVAVACPTINSKISVGFTTENDYQNGKKVYENSLLSNVKITVAAVATDAENVADYQSAVSAAKAPKLTFDGSGEGYFIMPEEVTSLVWAFEATHATDGAVARVGKIENVEAGKGYKVNFYYSRTADGYTGITVMVDDSTEDIESDFNFKPQPEITGEGLLADGVNVYALGSGGVSLVCESINDLQTLKLGGVAFFDGGEVVADHGIAGLTITKESATKVAMVMSDDFFNSLSGAMQTLEFDMLDTGGETIAQSIKFKKRGLMREAIVPDLWANTVAIEAFIPEQGVSDVKLRYRRSDAAEWHVLTAASNNEGTYTASSVAQWGEAKANEKGNAYFLPDASAESTSIFANKTYVCQLLIGDEVVDEYTLDTTTTQTIEGADFSSNTMSCFQSLHKDGNNIQYFWGSGNNDMTPELCKNYNGTAYLQATEQAGYLASGNLFTGQFEMTSATMGEVSFGVDYNWQARPTALKVDLKYNIKTVDIVKFNSQLSEQQNVTVSKGDADVATVYVCIIDWESQHKVASGGSPSGVWSPVNGVNAVSAGEIIGYGMLELSGSNGDNMETKTIEIKYYNKTAKPSKRYKLIIMASTSKYGDYMVGCKTNSMYVDNFSWVY